MGTFYPNLPILWKDFRVKKAFCSGTLKLIVKSYTLFKTQYPELLTPSCKNPLFLRQKKEMFGAQDLRVNAEGIWYQKLPEKISILVQM